MSLPSGSPFLRTPLGRLAVTGAASLVTVMGVAPAAMADDDLAPEATSTDQTVAASSVERSSTPEEETPAPPAEDTPPAPTEDSPEAPTEETPETPAEEQPTTGDEGTDEQEDPEAPTEESEAPTEAEETEEVSIAAAQLTLRDDTASVTEGRTVSIDVLNNDSSDDPIRSLTIEEQGDHGDAVVTGRPFVENFVSVPEAGDLRIQYQADDDFVGADTLTYRVTTKDGTTDTATVSIDVEEYVAPPVEASFGERKIRIGVQQADGSYVPEGASTAGSVIRIERIGGTGTRPAVETCTTEDDEFTQDDTRSSCDRFDGEPGATYAITQQEAAPGFVRSNQRFVIDPCYGFVITDPEVRMGIQAIDVCDSTDDITFVNGGSVLPEANADDEASSGGESVDVDVLANDTSDDPETELTLASQPGGGTAEIVGAAAEQEPEPDPDPVPLPFLDRVGVLAVPNAGTQQVRYTPDPGFEGVDTFTYRLTNGNGSDTATVRVRVSDNGAVSPIDTTDDSDASPASATVRGSGSGTLGSVSGLPSTGGPRSGLLALGAALVATGAAAVAGSRRRRDVAGG